MAKVYVYWNSKDNACRKIFHFMSEEDEYSVISSLKKENEIFVDRKYMYFPNNDSVIKSIKNADVIIFCTHGTPSAILKYLEEKDRPFNEFILIDERNMDVLENKVILAFCCASAKRLGRQCINGLKPCKAFVGFEGDIVYDNGKAKKSRHIIYESYKKAFMESIKYASENKCSIEKFKVILLINMRKEAANAIIETENHSLNDMYASAIDSLVALGNIEEPLFV